MDKNETPGGLQNHILSHIDSEYTFKEYNYNKYLTVLTVVNLEQIKRNFWSKEGVNIDIKLVPF